MARIGELIGPNGEVMHPKTSASVVYLEDGRSVEQVLSDDIDYGNVVFQDNSYKFDSDVEDDFAKTVIIKGQTYQNILPEPSTHVLTNNKEMFKVNEGLDPNVEIVDGVSKSAILSGQTLVNLLKPTSHSSFITYDNGVITFTNPHGPGNISFSADMLKPSTKYFFKANFKCDSVWDYAFRTDLFPDNFPELAKFTPTVQGSNCYQIFTTPSNIDELISFRIYVSEAVNGVATISNAMLLEYQEGMENWDIPYFEGMQSVKMPVLTTTGKNLWDKKNFVNGVIDGESIRVSASGLDDTRFYYDFKENQQYVFTLTSYSENKKLVYFRYNYTDGTNSGYTNFLPYNGEKKHFISSANKTILYISFIFSDHDNYTLSNVQLEEGSIATSYEPFKSNILTVNDDVTLQSVGEVHDTIDCLTGEMIECISETVLNGSEHWTITNNTFRTTSIADKVIKLTTATDRTKIFISCDKYESRTYNDTWTSGKFISLHADKLIVIRDENFTTVQEWKQYLSQNPLTVKFVLATPTIKTVDLNVVDQNNTKIDKIHVFNEITHVNASSDELTPTVNIGKSVSYPTIIKPNTKYTVDLKRNDKPLTVNLGGTEVIFVDGETRKTITTPSTLTNDKLSYYGVGAKCNEIMLIEGEIERNIDYFTGMQSVVMQNQMPILHTNGKNLFDLELTQGGHGYGVAGIKPDLSWSSNRVTNLTGTYIKVNPNTKITFSILNNIDFAIAELDINGHTLGDTGWVGYTTIKPNHTITTKEKTSYIGFNFRKFDNSNITVQEVLDSNPMLEISGTATTYEPYKSSILSCNDDVTLRGIGEVQDTLDCLRGELTERISEIVLDGSDDEGWRKDSGNSNDVSTLFFRKIINAETGIGVCISDIMPSLNGFNPEYGNDGIFIDYASDLDIRISNSKLVSNDVSGFRQWLSQNPITIQYKLKTPVIKTVDLNVVDQDGNTIPKIKSYKDVTHLEITVPKQSLLSHISAEVATDNSKDMSSLTTKHQEISEAQSVIEDNIQSQSDEIDTALMATTEIFESILE